MRVSFSDGAVISAMRINAGLTVEQLAQAVGYQPLLIQVLERQRGLVAGSAARKVRRYLEGLKAHERLVNVSSRARGVGSVRRLPIDWEFPCGATTRAGTPCKMKVTFASGRCKLHGGLSTGPQTPAGKERVREGQRKRRERERAATLIK